MTNYLFSYWNQEIPSKEQIDTIKDRVEPSYMFSNVGKGWWNILIETDALMRFIAPSYTIEQIKEKFGTLRYYWDWQQPEDMSDDEYDKLYSILYIISSRAEECSARVCENCGSCQKVKNQAIQGWWQTLCEVCYNEFSSQRK